eukprot:10674645-Lingulodinium_polyedra.AAC.1
MCTPRGGDPAEACGRGALRPSSSSSEAHSGRRGLRRPRRGGSQPPRRACGRWQRRDGRAA